MHLKKIQDEYRKDMIKYKKQIEYYNKLMKKKGF